MKKRIVSLFLCLVILFNVSFAATAIEVSDFNAENLELFKELIHSLFYEEVTDRELYEAALKGMFQSLDPYCNYYNAEESEEFNTDVSGKYSGIGIKFEVCHLPFSLKIMTDPSYIPKFEKDVYNAIDAARMLGAEYAVMHPNTVSVPAESFNRTKCYDEVMSHLSPFVNYANKMNVRIAVENMRVVHKPYPTHRYCQDPDELCDIADALGTAVCWDFGHANIGGLCQSESIKYVGSRLKVLHVNDNTGADDDHMPPFIGRIDWRDAMKGLSEIGFKGLFNYEIETGRVPALLRDSLAEYLVNAAKEIISYI